jgi:hypothetical protein
MHRDDDNLLFVETQVLTPHILELVANDKSADDQDNTDGKLRDNQETPEGAAFSAHPQSSFQGPHGLEGGQKNGRIQSAENTDNQYNTQHPQKKGKIAEEIQGKLFSGQGIEHRQEKPHQNHGEKNTDDRIQHGFAEELSDQLVPESPQHFPHPYLPGSFGGPGGGQVHEIESSNQ